MANRPRPHPLTVTDELLVHLLDGHEQLAAAINDIRDVLRDRLPQPVAQDPPGTRELREPAMPGSGAGHDDDPEPEPEHQPAKRTPAKAPATGTTSTTGAARKTGTTPGKRAAPRKAAKRS